MKRLIASAAFAAMLAAAPAAYADPVEFAFDRAALDAPDGADAVYTDAVRRAHQLCYNGQPALRALYETCKASLVDQFVEAIDDDDLRAIHLAAAGGD